VSDPNANDDVMARALNDTLARRVMRKLNHNSDKLFTDSIFMFTLVLLLGASYLEILIAYDN
jgi:hypothetical protein